jgi:hypothetical protein
MMHVRDWRVELIEAHSGLFHPPEGHPEHSAAYPRCEQGWSDVLKRLCFRIEAALDRNERFEFVRVEQNMGVLRVCWDGAVVGQTNIKIQQAVNLAVARSGCTCEICGAEGRRYRSHGSLVTACSDHALGDLVSPRPGFEKVCALRSKPGSWDIYIAHYDRESDTLTENSRLDGSA